MKVKEGIVYDKHNAQVIVFVDVGDINNQLAEFETQCHQNDSGMNHPVATHILALMVQGIFMKLEFLYAHFLTMFPQTMAVVVIAMIDWILHNQPSDITESMVCIYR